MDDKEIIEWYKARYGMHIEKRGLHNWRNLFRKPNLYEWLILFMILMSLFISWAYQRDISLCREVISHDFSIWENLTNGTGVIKFEAEYNMPNLTIPNITFLPNGQ